MKVFIAILLAATMAYIFGLWDGASQARIACFKVRTEELREINRATGADHGG